MESKLSIKNFGPIKDVNLTLKNVNVFIGPQASGKSAIAKLYTIFKAPRKFFYKNNSLEKKDVLLNDKITTIDFLNVLKEYNIDSFISPDTEIIFDSGLHSISYINKEFIYTPKLLIKIWELESLIDNFELNKRKIISTCKKIGIDFLLFAIQSNDILDEDASSHDYTKFPFFDKLNKENFGQVLNILKSNEEDLSTKTALYIPSERNFVNIIKKYSINLFLNNVPIPQHILSFAAELEKLKSYEIDLGFLQKGLKFKVSNGEDKIYLNKNQSILLTEAASGIQSVVPILLPILANTEILHRSFVIEEPELNLFPDAQYELIQCLELNRKNYEWEDVGTIHTYTTHSPYILSALNNLLYADKIKEKLNTIDRNKIEVVTIDAFKEYNLKNSLKVQKIVQAQINSKTFTAYQISNGKAKSIFDKKSGLIKENFIDETSDKINDDFEELMELGR